jgi:hypothetical protein
MNFLSMGEWCGWVDGQTENLMDALQGCKLAYEGLALQAALNFVLFVDINSNFCPALDRGSYGFFFSINQTPFLSLPNP